MGETLEYLNTFAHFPFSLRRFTQSPLTAERARQIMRERMDRREENFLRIVERSIYGYARSPYLPLLNAARCRLSDLRALVKEKGLEGALSELRAAGVYVTFEELKGRKPIVRNGLELDVTARDFDNPFLRRGVAVQSGGSTGLAMLVNQDLDFLADESPHLILALAAHRILGAPFAIWNPFLPGQGFRNILQMAHAQQPLQRWFAPNGWRDSKYWLKYDVATLYMIFWMRFSGLQVPLPEIVRLDQARSVARWIGETLQANGRCLLFTGISRAVRVCVAAAEQGIDLTGAYFRGGGEPITPAKVAAVQRSGARFIASYVMAEAGAIGYGCAQPSDVSDVHFHKDMLALITFPYSVPGFDLTVPAFNLTTLLDTAPKILLNAQTDDYGIVEERACGCELEAIGFTTHLREIRSYSKLLGEGVTLIGNEMLKILEEILPARFGGSPLDYQLLEREDAAGLTRVYLVISPRVQISDEPSVVATVLNALRESSPMADAARAVWQEARTIQIIRQEPEWTRSGKLMPLRVQRRQEP